MRRLKDKKGYIDGEAIIGIIFILIFIGVIGFGIFRFIYSRTVGNKTAVDLKYKYDKAIVSINNEKIEIEIDTWSDYEGEQLQIISKDGKVYLVSSLNTILVKE